MKHFVFCLIATLFTTFAHSQDLFDAVRFSEGATSGNARSTGMGGAFDALGGDPTCLSTNPAGLGIYRSSEFTIGVNNQYTNTRSDWGNVKYARSNKFSFGQLAYIHSFLRNNSRILIASNWGFSYARLKNFRKEQNISGNLKSISLTDYIANMTNGVPETSLIEKSNPYQNTSIGWLSVLGYNALLIEPYVGNNWKSLNNVFQTPTYQVSEHGSLDEMNFSYGANLNHLFYLGASLGFRLLDYSSKSSYTETFENGQRLKLNNEFRQTGTGWNLKLGILARPFSFWRLGFAYHTPSFYSISQSTLPEMNSYSITNSKNELVDISTSPGESSDKYYLYSPSRFLFSTGFIIKKKGAIDLDYEITDFRSMKYVDPEKGSFSSQNRFIKENATLSHLIRLGGEYRVIDAFSLRIGGGIATPSMKATTQKQMSVQTLRTDAEYFIDNGSYWISGGFGFRYGNWGIDFAYQFRQKAETYNAFATANAKSSAIIKTNFHNILLTGSYRF